eukprot:gnl/TRDRNA2_/TRDRNA2_155645_c0_seq1.p1 gnl/TRDRNA2_/TRDRNA2_155645_c0~~gnl/TRDRNA2_/TRDRNA2_155645_c0_seq1.p1  ORF type:complete len:704 (+),score=144.75 gnl/TRDRNA2_/TRDRNA2_155645_c0_seq1:281-2113(+)
MLADERRHRDSALQLVHGKLAECIAKETLRSSEVAVQLDSQRETRRELMDAALALQDAGAEIRAEQSEVRREVQHEVQSCTEALDMQRQALASELCSLANRTDSEARHHRAAAKAAAASRTAMGTVVREIAADREEAFHETASVALAAASEVEGHVMAALSLEGERRAAEIAEVRSVALRETQELHLRVEKLSKEAAGRRADLSADDKLCLRREWRQDMARALEEDASASAAESSWEVGRRANRAFGRRPLERPSISQGDRLELRREWRQDMDRALEEAIESRALTSLNPGHPASSRHGGLSMQERLSLRCEWRADVAGALDEAKAEAEQLANGLRAETQKWAAGVLSEVRGAADGVCERLEARAVQAEAVCEGRSEAAAGRIEARIMELVRRPQPPCSPSTPRSTCRRRSDKVVTFSLDAGDEALETCGHLQGAYAELQQGISELRRGLAAVSPASASNEASPNHSHAQGFPSLSRTLVPADDEEFSFTLPEHLASALRSTGAEISSCPPSEEPLQGSSRLGGTLQHRDRCTEKQVADEGVVCRPRTEAPTSPGRASGSDASRCYAGRALPLCAWRAGSEPTRDSSCNNLARAANKTAATSAVELSARP